MGMGKIDPLRRLKYITKYNPNMIIKMIKIFKKSY